MSNETTPAGNAVGNAGHGIRIRYPPLTAATQSRSNPAMFQARSRRDRCWSAVSGKFFANAAWLACAVLAHNVTRWTARLGNVHPDDHLTVARTVRTRVLALLGRLVNRSGRPVLRLPAWWPWRTTFSAALDQLRALPMLS